MEKLFIHYKDGGRLTVTTKRKSANPMKKWRSDYASMGSRIKLAWIQKYPKKDNPPIVLVENTESEEN